MDQYIIKWYIFSLKPLFDAKDFETVSNLLRNKKIMRNMNRIINVIYNQNI